MAGSASGAASDPTEPMPACYALPKTSHANSQQSDAMTRTDEDSRMNVLSKAERYPGHGMAGPGAPDRFFAALAEISSAGGTVCFGVVRSDNTRELKVAARFDTLEPVTTLTLGLTLEQSRQMIRTMREVNTAVDRTMTDAARKKSTVLLQEFNDALITARKLLD